MPSYRLSKKQNEFIRCADARYNLKIGAVRSGKSFVDIVHVIPERIMERANEQGLNLILGVSKETIERNVLQPMREWYTDEIVGSINNRNIALICGAPVYCLGAEKVNQVAKIQGMSVKYCYGDEISKWNEEVFHMLQSRLDKPYSCFDGACNPESPGHWLKQFIDRDDIDAYIQKYTIFDNPFLPKDFIDNLCKEYEGTVYYDRYILGNWALAEGLIYPMYQDAIAEPPDVEFERYVVSLDYGTMNAFAALIWGKYDGIWYALEEYYYSGRDTGIQKTDDEYGEALDRFVSGFPYGERIPVIIDPSAASFIALLRKKGNYKVITADNSVADGIRETAAAMKRGLVKISPSCQNWTKEAQGYVWDETAADDRPVKENDHCLVGETLIDTEYGQKPISKLVGTSGNVWSYNKETGVAELKPYFNCRMTQEQVEVYEIETEDGRIIRCTDNHPILTQRGYVLAKNLVVTDRIIDIGGSIKTGEA